MATANCNTHAAYDVEPAGDEGAAEGHATHAATVGPPPALYELAGHENAGTAEHEATSVEPPTVIVEGIEPCGHVAVTPSSARGMTEKDFIAEELEAGVHAVAKPLIALTLVLHVPTLLIRITAVWKPA
jgi:hypothetical protein